MMYFSETARQQKIGIKYAVVLLVAVFYFAQLPA